MIEEALCREFCNQIQVRQVPAGLAVGTKFIGINGDHIGFYVVGPNASGRFRVEDNGATVPMLEAAGADLELESRSEAFRHLLIDYDAEYDDERGELKTGLMVESDIPKAALRFLALLLRIQDLLMMTRERAENTFRQEAIRDLRNAIKDRAEIAEDDVVCKELNEFRADVVIRSANGAPTAVFFVMGDAKLYEAMLLQTDATLKARIDCKVIALMEHGEDSVSKRAFRQAMNRLIPLRYRGDEKEAIDRIVREALRSNSAVLN